ncbi:MAG: dephospho-CoA kinase, partial [Chloroflexota bacterium]
MSHWTGKYVIGLTGNIGTGKSVIRKMLEHLGAFGIDADGLSHQATAKGGPAYDQVVQAFGEFVVGEDGQIDRQALGNIVFANPKALAKLEAIIHPIVRQAVDILSKRATQKVIVIEAIKLLEGDIAGWCDAVWVVNAPDDVQIARLMQKRKMTSDQARQRIQSQNIQADKLAKANVVIQNAGSFEEAWVQVQAAWATLVSGGFAQPEEAATTFVAATQAATVIRSRTTPAISVRRGKPADATAIAAFVNQVSKPSTPLTRTDIMEAFGQKAFTLAQVNGALGALAGWRVDNLVTRIDELHLLPEVSLDSVLKPMLEAIELSSSELQSEASFIFLPPAMNASAAAFSAVGYEPIM